MKLRFLALLSTLFALAAISLVILQVVQTRRSAEMSDNLFSISVNSAMDDVFSQLDQMRVEDYVDARERYRLLRYRRIEELNEKMNDIIRENSELFYDEQRVSFGVSSQDSAIALRHAHFTTTETNAISQYNTLLGARNRLVAGTKKNYPTTFADFTSHIDITKINFKLLDSLIREELVIHGVDANPQTGILLTSKDSLIYCSDNADSSQLKNSPFKFDFHAGGISPTNEIYILLAFPSAPIILNDNSSRYTVFSIFLVVLITLLFVFSVRTIMSQRKLDEMKTDFINNMTHEIKTPIATISLACQMLKDESVTSDTSTRQNFVNIISDENRRMRILIETLLQSAKMSGKKFSLSLKEIDLNSLVNESVQSFNLTIENRHGSITTDLQPINGILYADALHISNMVHNLIDNAIKYSNNAPVITVTTRTEQGMAVLRVSDQGIGIAKEDQKRIFEKFYRVSTGNIHNVKGFGIGLNYVYQVVQLHKGHIQLISELDKGSTFIITLPLV